MRVQEIAGTIAKLGSAEKWLRIISAAVVMGLIMSIGFVVPASAGGAMQISGILRWAEEGECETYPADLTLIFMEGPLEGCVYDTIESSVWHPSGIYIEIGTEIYDITGGTFGTGTFRTDYRAMGKYATVEDFSVEIFGSCQHPIVAGSGTGDFKGVTGRIDVNDDVAKGNFPYKGHLKR